MRDVTRRDVCAGLSALALAGAGEVAGRAMQVHAAETPASNSTPNSTAAQSAPPAQAAGGTLTQARVFRFADSPARPTAVGGETRVITHGTLSTGETVNLHAGMQPEGAAPVPLHVIHHTEFIVVREGEVEFEHQDSAGTTLGERAGPGDVVYVPNGTNHRIKNVGTGPANYLVVAIGGDAK